MEHAIQMCADYRLRPGRVSSQLLAQALCQYDCCALIHNPKRNAKPVSGAEYSKNLDACLADMDSVYARCAETHSTFGLSAEDFRAGVTAAVDKYLGGFGSDGKPPSADQIREFITELQSADLYLALACERGNESAWQKFDREYRSFIERLARHLLATRADADEVIDHVYAELFGTKVVDGVRQSKFRTYTGRGTLQGWLRAVVSHAVIDFYRRRQDEVSLDKLEESGEETKVRHSRLGHAHRSEDSMLANVVRKRYRTVTVEALDQALATLDDHEKLLLLYYHVEGLKLREIARIVEEPMSPIRRWFQRRGRSGGKTGRVHESTVMRWLEKAYQKVSERFHAELGKKHGLKAEEIEICMSIATEDLGEGVNLKSIAVKDQGFSKVNAVEGAS
jgi:RNA polymerase sigma-70 factor